MKPLPFALVAAVACVAMLPPRAGAQPSLDVLGFRLGMTYDEALAQARSLNMKAAHGEHVVQIQGLPNATYRPRLDASDMGPGGLVMLVFSPPPGPSRLVTAVRVMDYASLKHPGPAGGATTQALLQRFGKPSAVEQPGGFTRMVWVWDAQRTLQARDPGTRAASSLAATSRTCRTRRPASTAASSSPGAAACVMRCS